MLATHILKGIQHLRCLYPYPQYQISASVLKKKTQKPDQNFVFMKLYMYIFIQNSVVRSDFC